MEDEGLVRLRAALSAGLMALFVAFPATAQAWKPERAASHASRAFFRDVSGVAPLQSKSVCRRTRPGELYYFPWSDDWWACNSRVRHGGTRAVFEVYAHRGDEWGHLTDKWHFTSVAVVIEL